MGELSKIGHVPPSVTPADTGSVADAAPVSNAAQIKPGNWAAPSYCDLDKVVTKDLDELANASLRLVADLGFLGSAHVDDQIKDAQKLVDARNQLHKDVASLIAAAPPEGMTLTDSAARAVGDSIIGTYAYIRGYPKTLIADAVNSALASRTHKE